MDGRTVKGVNFVDIRDAGDPVELAVRYAEEGADELVFLDITATNEKRKTLVPLVKRIAQHLNIPFTVGGGIRSLEDALMVLNAGADKIAVNSAAVRDPKLIKELAEALGSQCVVLAVDTRQNEDNAEVYIGGGKIKTGLNTIEWVQEAEQMGCGELLLTSINADGTKKGFDINITNRVCKAVNIPVIASGGAGDNIHFDELFKRTHASAGLAASIFHFGEIAIPDLKKYLKENNIPIR